MRDSIFEIYGFAAIFGAAVGLMLLIQQALGMPDVVQSLAQLSPWAGANAKTLSWVAMGIVFLSAVAIPPVLMSKDLNDGGARLGAIGFTVWAVLLIPSVGYLLSVGWYGAKHVFGR